jgi:hypothetical protein
MVGLGLDLHEVKGKFLLGVKQHLRLTYGRLWRFNFPH